MALNSQYRIFIMSNDIFTGGQMTKEEIKAKIFDILRELETLQTKATELNNEKTALLTELFKLEHPNKEDKEVKEEVKAE